MIDDETNGKEKHQFKNKFNQKFINKMQAMITSQMCWPLSGFYSIYTCLRHKC